MIIAIAIPHKYSLLSTSNGNYIPSRHGGLSFPMMSAAADVFPVGKMDFPSRKDQQRI